MELNIFNRLVWNYESIDIGAFGTVTSAIIRKFGKEGARIYALTGGKNSENRYKKVYEQYDFSYD